MKILELFCGTKSFSKVAQQRGFETTTIDLDPQFNATYTLDILNVDLSLLDNYYDVIWASPPCTAFSVASMGRHWNYDRTPKTESAELGLKLLNRTIEIIKILKPKYWFIENPRGMMRKFMPLDSRHTVTYCQYGDTRMKPTDIWTNLPNWEGKRCYNGMPCHVRAPRGSRTGTQGMKNAKDRSVIPERLFVELFDIIDTNSQTVDSQ